MIFIDKNTVEFPYELNSPLTKKRREELIKAEQYIDAGIYNSRYKTKDVKKSLDKLYNNKCAYCEQKVEQGQVEHFRPKKTYYWLAYSWDNLLRACPVCNTFKNDYFITLKKPVSFSKNDLENIHNCAESYNKLEESKLIHPELDENIESKIKFSKKGEVFSDDENVNYTIDLCRLNRKYLVGEREKVLSKYEQERNLIALMFKESGKRKIIEYLTLRYKQDIEDTDNEYLAFRRYAVKNFIIKQQ